MLRECKLYSAVLRDTDCCFSLLQPSGRRAAPSSPSAVAFLRSHYPSSSVQAAVFSPLDDAPIFIKPEPLHDVDMGAQFPGIGAHGDERAGASPVLPTRLQVLPRLQDSKYKVSPIASSKQPTSVHRNPG
ncbi:hypothetical protein PR003_g25467 [Phytophthora rubi]|uniref:Uncharacterized protein n=1 Tax=Phytophthora rubi TaxID=129364 RepID=A0A6A4CER6_9STRA|nr:hypothetical protein PR003_g25467 [Phytophthora rubi]